MLVIVIDILAENEPQVPFTGDQHPVQALAATRSTVVVTEVTRCFSHATHSQSGRSLGSWRFLVAMDAHPTMRTTRSEGRDQL